MNFFVCVYVCMCVVLGVQCRRSGTRGPGRGQRAISLKVHRNSLPFVEPGKDEDSIFHCLSPSCADSNSTVNTR